MDETQDRKYSLAEVRAAFQKTFFRAGEVWFEYLGTDEDAQDCVDGHWQDLRDSLTDPDSVSRPQGGGW